MSSSSRSDSPVEKVGPASVFGAPTNEILELSWDQLEARLRETDIALIPIGSVEPHGRHAPLGSDTYIAEELARRVAGATGGLVFPGLPLGSMNLSYDFRHLPGAISIDPDVLIPLYVNVGTELVRSGFRRLVFVNGHGPNSSMLQIAAYQIRERVRAEIGVLEWWTTSSEEIRRFKGVSYGTHADEVETSLVLASSRAGTVDLTAAEAHGDVTDHLSEEQSFLYRAKIPFTRTLDERWVGEAGNMGDPSHATVEAGHLILDRAAEVGVVLLRALAEELEARDRSGVGGRT